MRKVYSGALLVWLATFNISPAQTFVQADVVPIDQVPVLKDHIFDESLLESFGMSLGAAPSIPPRNMLPISIILVQYFEQWVPKPYDDPVGYCTIGYGHLISLKRCELLNPLDYAEGITKSQGDSLLEKDTIYSRRAVQSLVNVPLSDEQFSALASFVFNIGKDNFEKSTMLRRLVEGDFQGAARQFPLWIKADGQVLEGLVKRRACERQLFIGDLHLTSDGLLDGHSCLTLGGAPSGTLIDIRKGE